MQEVLRFCEAEQDILLLDFNPGANIYQANTYSYLALSHLTSFKSQGYCFAYPRPSIGRQNSIAPMSGLNASFDSGGSGDVESQVSYEYGLSDKFLDSFPYSTENSLPPGTVAIVSAVHIIQKKLERLAELESKNSDQTGGQNLSAKEIWDRTMAKLDQCIQGHFFVPRWNKCKSLATELLRHKKICIHEDGRSFYYQNKPWTNVSTLHFLGEVTRRNSPLELALLKRGKTKSVGKMSKGLQRSSLREEQARLYSYYVKKLLDNNAPLDLFTNKMFLPKEYLR